MSKTKSFQTEVQQLLDLVIHSLYSNREIFLRELISNSSDAIDQARFLSLTDKSVAEPEGGWRIKLAINQEAGEIHVRDNGIGMTAAEVEENIGTIAHSGTKAFLKHLKESEQADQPELIGQFGVGFYSAFMVADRVTLTTKRAGSDEPAVRWSSAGGGTYEIGEDDREFAGTAITLHLKEDAREFLDRWKLREIVKKYSDYIAVPIVMDAEPPPEPEEGGDDDAEDKDKDAEADQKGETPEEETLNSMRALWTRPKSEIEPEEYNEFYKARFHDWNDPLRVVHVSAEGTLEYKAMVFVPGQRPPDFMRDAFGKGVQLHVKRVLIMNECEEMLPEYLSFVRGVVDSSDLSLNVSREILQEDRTVARIRKSLAGRILSNLKELKESDSAAYGRFHAAFGAHLKDGVCRRDEHKDKLLELVQFESSKTEAGEFTTLKDYVTRMQPDQKAIYFLAGPSRDMVERSPYLEAFREKDLEVLFFTDPVDEWFSDAAGPFEEKPLQAIDKGEADLLSEDEKKEAETAQKEAGKKFKPVIKAIEKRLGEQVKEVRFTDRLTDSAACLVADAHGMSANQERIMQAFGQDVSHTPRILELNPKHELLERLLAMHQADKKDETIGDYIDLLYDQALIHEGSPVKDPARFTQLVTRLMVGGQ